METLNESAPTKPLRVLFLCTGKSARSQIAEALLMRKARGRFTVASAGSEPAPHVNPLTVGILQEFGIDWSGRAPKGIDRMIGEAWDLIMDTVHYLSRRIDLLLALPVEQLEKLALEQRVRAIATQPPESSPSPGDASDTGDRAMPVSRS